MALAVRTACTLSACDLHVRTAGKCVKVLRAASQCPIGRNVQLIQYMTLFGKMEKADTCKQAHNVVVYNYNSRRH